MVYFLTLDLLQFAISGVDVKLHMAIFIFKQSCI